MIATFVRDLYKEEHGGLNKDDNLSQIRLRGEKL